MKRMRAILCVAMLTAVAVGCVERRYVITTDPPGAAVYRNGEYIGNTPVDDPFLYYGNYHFTIRKEGFATQQVNQEITTPFYEYWPLDFVSEVLVPYHIEDVRYLHYQLQPLQPPNIPALLSQGQNLRNEGMTLTPKHPQPTPAPGTPPAAPVTAVPATLSPPAP